MHQTLLFEEPTYGDSSCNEPYSNVRCVIQCLIVQVQYEDEAVAGTAHYRYVKMRRRGSSEN